VFKRFIFVVALTSSLVGVSNANLPDFTDLVEDVAPAVVKINTVGLAETNSRELQLQEQMPDIFRELLQQRRRPSAPTRTMGSGFVISSDGYILTNHHVIDGADKIQVQFSDRREYAAALVGSDRASDLALLKIEASGLPSLVFAEPDSTEVGAWVLAIGSPFGLDYSVAAGIVSAIGRSLPTEQGENYVPFIQTDVAINRGNSGGPLFNLDGEVVGINSQIFSPTGGSVGLSFSIPVSVATNVVSQLRENGQVERGFLGVGIGDVNKDLAQALGMPGPMGAAIRSVSPNSAADKGGILAGDVVVSIDGQPIVYASDLPHKVGLIEPGSKIEVDVYRDGRLKTLEIVVGVLQGESIAEIEQQSTTDRLGLIVVEPTSKELRARGASGGVMISEVAVSSPADAAGLRDGDVIVQLGYSRITDLQAYTAVVDGLPVNTPVAIRFFRDGQAIFRTIKLNK
jgi:serine protease Do